MSVLVCADTCYQVQHQNATLLVRALRQVVPNPQGDPGPLRWVATCFCVLDGEPVKDGDEIEVLDTAFVRHADKKEMVRRCLLQGWDKNGDIASYLQDWGIDISYGQVANTKHQLKKGSQPTPEVPPPSQPEALPLPAKEEGLHVSMSLLLRAARDRYGMDDAGARRFIEEMGHEFILLSVRQLSAG